jgi:hypothetical protein
MKLLMLQKLEGTLRVRKFLIIVFDSTGSSQYLITSGFAILLRHLATNGEILNRLHQLIMKALVRMLPIFHRVCVSFFTLTVQNNFQSRHRASIFLNLSTQFSWSNEVIIRRGSFTIRHSHSVPNYTNLI